MATLQITQIPTETATYTGTANTYAELVPTNYWPILPITVKITDNLSSYFKVKYILRVYNSAVSASNLLATIKQRTNNASSTSNQVAIFDVRNIINTQLDATYSDSANPTDEIHTLGQNTTTKIFHTTKTQFKPLCSKQRGNGQLQRQNHLQNKMVALMKFRSRCISQTPHSHCLVLWIQTPTR